MHTPVFLIVQLFNCSVVLIQTNLESAIVHLDYIVLGWVDGNRGLTDRGFCVYDALAVEGVDRHLLTSFCARNQQGAF